MLEPRGQMTFFAYSMCFYGEMAWSLCLVDPPYLQELDGKIR